MAYSFSKLPANQESREIIFRAERMHVSTASWLKSFEFSVWCFKRPSKRQRQGRKRIIRDEENCMARPMRERILGPDQSGGVQVSSKVISNSEGSLSRQVRRRRSMRCIVSWTSDHISFIVAAQ